MGYVKPDKSGNNRSGQRARKLQLSDVDWYEPNRNLSRNVNPPNPEGLKILSVNSTVHGRGRSDISAHGSGTPFPRVERPARSTRQVGKLSRREILAEHASRLAKNKNKSRDNL